jgi:uncharacterized membrane protein
MEMSLSPLELQQEINFISTDNKAGFEALAELVMNDVEALCLSNDITDPGEITAVMNTAQFNFEFKFGFNLAMAKLKIQTTGTTDENIEQ